MLTLPEFLAYIDEAQQRTLRDIAAIPESALTFAPPQGAEGEATWPVARIIGHIAGTRLRFAEGFANARWIVPHEPDIASTADAIAALEQSAAEVMAHLHSAPESRLTDEVPGAAAGSLPGWRILMMMLEHEIHHRSQLDAYAAFANWSAPQLYGRRWEDVRGGFSTGR